MKGRCVVPLSIVFPNDLKERRISGSRDCRTVAGQISARRESRVIDQDRACRWGLTRRIGAHREMDDRGFCRLGDRREGREFIERLHANGRINGGREWSRGKTGKRRKASSKGWAGGDRIGGRKRPFHSPLYQITCLHSLFYPWIHMTWQETREGRERERREFSMSDHDKSLDRKGYHIPVEKVPFEPR